MKQGFLELGLANSRSKNLLDKYSIDERVTTNSTLSVK